MFKYFKISLWGLFQILQLELEPNPIISYGGKIQVNRVNYVVSITIRTPFNPKS